MESKKKPLKYYEAVGRRKTATALIRLYIVGKEKTVKVNNLAIKAGEIFVNGKKIEQYFPLKIDKDLCLLPLKLTNNLDRFAVSIIVKGGGKKGQLQAIVHGLAKALVLVDETYKKVLKKEGLLRRDAREKQRRQVGKGGKARREKQSPKR